MRNLAAAFLLATFSATCWSGGAPLAQTDLTVSVTATPAKPSYRFGDFLTINVTVTNRGPAESPYWAVNIGDYVFAHPTQQVVIFAIEETLPCDFYVVDFAPPPNGPGFIDNFIQHGPLHAGASQTCSVGMQIVTHAEGTLLLDSLVFNRAPSAVDPVPENNTDQLLISIAGIEPMVVPTAGWIPLLVLALLLLTSVGAMKKQSISVWAVAALVPLLLFHSSPHAAELFVGPPGKPNPDPAGNGVRLTS
jgi:hypothetical protein